MDPLLLLLLFVAVLALPLILGSRRQKRAMAEAQQLQSSLVEGDRVMTTSGLYATVVGVDDEDTVDLEIAPDVYTTWVRAAVREKVTDDQDDQDDEDDDVVVDEHDESVDAEAQLAGSREDRARTERS